MAMTSIGPTTLNVVVPALPQMANRLASDVATIQLTVTVYLLALAGRPACRWGRCRTASAAGR